MAEDVRAWFASRVPDGWFARPPDVTADGDEILVVGTLPDVELAAGTAGDGRAAARAARIERFREETREDRIRIAREAERHFRRKVAWGARCGPELKIFTTLSVPVMTRLRMNERTILDTLVAGGVARRVGARGLLDGLDGAQVVHVVGEEIAAHPAAQRQPADRA